MNDAKIQNLAKIIEDNIREIDRLSGELAVMYGMLHEELPFADPVQDKKFEDFLLRLTRFRWGIAPDVLNSIIASAQEMQSFVSTPSRPDLRWAARTSQTVEMAALKS